MSKIAMVLSKQTTHNLACAYSVHQLDCNFHQCGIIPHAGNGLMYMMATQRMVLLLQRRAWDRHALDHTQIIYKPPEWTFNGHTKVLHGVMCISMLYQFSPHESPLMVQWKSPGIL
jgi:hypothetical protein